MKNLIIILITFMFLGAALHAAEIEAVLSTNNGSTVFAIVDSSSVEVTHLTSDGDVLFDGILECNGTGSSYFMGKLGIGTMNPFSSLSLHHTTPVILFETDLGDSDFWIGAVSVVDGLDNDMFQIGKKNGGVMEVYFSMGTSGEVGIGLGMGNPQAQLEVDGGIMLASSETALDGTVSFHASDFWGRSGGSWVSLTTGGTGAVSLDSLSNTTITAPVSGEVLTYNGTIWVNVPGGSGGTGPVALNDLSDVNVPSPPDQGFLKWCNTFGEWTAETIVQRPTFEVEMLIDDYSYNSTEIYTKTESDDLFADTIEIEMIIDDYSYNSFEIYTKAETDATLEAQTLINPAGSNGTLEVQGKIDSWMVTTTVLNAMGGTVETDHVCATVVETFTVETQFIQSMNSYTVGDQSIAFGQGCSAMGNYSAALGNDCHALGDNCIAFGQGCSSEILSSVALGYETKASGMRSTALGSKVVANGTNSFGIGLDTAMSYCTIENANTMAIIGGNVGIGRTDPVATLDVLGTVEIAGTLEVHGSVEVHGSLTGGGMLISCASNASSYWGQTSVSTPDTVYYTTEVYIPEGTNNLMGKFMIRGMGAATAHVKFKIGGSQSTEGTTSDVNFTDSGVLTLASPPTGWQLLEILAWQTSGTFCEIRSYHLYVMD